MCNAWKVFRLHPSDSLSTELLRWGHDLSERVLCMFPSCVPRKLHSLTPFVHVALGLLRFCLVVSQLHPVQASVGRSCHGSIPGLLPQETMTPAGPRAQAVWLCFCPWPCVCSLFCSWGMQHPGSCGQLGPTLPGLCCFLHFISAL